MTQPSSNRDSLPYRQAVQVHILNDKGQVLIVRTPEKEFWKIPQGGVEEGESDEEAAIREMKEELGVDISIVMKLEGKNTFEWPDEQLHKHNFKYKGQSQTRFIATIQPGQTITPDPREIGAYQWIGEEDIDTALSLPHQREQLKAVLSIAKRI